jgi:tyrosinase
MMKDSKFPTRRPLDNARTINETRCPAISFSRRDFLATSAFLGVSTMLGKVAASQTPSGAQIVRKDIRELAQSPDELDKYREAFRRLKNKGPERPVWQNPNDANPYVPPLNNLQPLGYAYQAALHNYHCPHGNWWFLPWHRVYLFYFEQVLRAAVADYKPDVPLAIAYWNWTDQRDLPDVFRGDPSTNPLADDRRYWDPQATPETALTDADVGQTTMSADVDDVGAFEDFGSSSVCQLRDQGRMSPFESGPHGMVHVRVGWYDGNPIGPWHYGRPGTFRYVPTAAFDPVFWSHHANLDRLWNYWLSLADPSTPGDHQNPAFDAPCLNGQATWGGIQFPDFVDGTGMVVNRTLQASLTDPALQGVAYKTYMDGIVAMGPQTRGAAMRESTPRTTTASITATPLLRVGAPVTLSIDTNADEVRERVRSVMTARNPKGRAAPLMFHINELDVPENGAPPLEVRAFVNKTDAKAETPTSDPHFSGSFGFFGTHAGGHAMGPGKANFALNLGPTIRRLGAQLDLAKPITVTLVLVPMVNPSKAKGLPLSLPFKEAKVLLDR